MILLIKNFHLEMIFYKTINFQIRVLDLQAMGGGGDSTEKNVKTVSIIIPYMNLIHQRVWK